MAAVAPRQRDAAAAIPGTHPKRTVPGAERRARARAGGLQEEGACPVRPLITFNPAPPRKRLRLLWVADRRRIRVRRRGSRGAAFQSREPDATVRVDVS